MHFHNDGRFNPVKIIPWIILGIAGAAALALIFGLVVMALWNWLMPELFGLPLIGYWQAWGLVLLAHILFKSGQGHGGHSHEGFSRRSEAGRDEWKQRFKERFGGTRESADMEQPKETGDV